MGGNDNQWYTNKDLHQMLINFERTLEKTMLELKATQEKMDRYNGLIEKLTVCEQDIATLKTVKQARSDLMDKIRLYSSWLLPFVIFALTYITLRR